MKWLVHGEKITECWVGSWKDGGQVVGAVKAGTQLWSPAASGKETKSKVRSHEWRERCRVETSKRNDSLRLISQWCLWLLGGVDYAETRVKAESLDIAWGARVAISLKRKGSSWVESQMDRKWFQDLYVCQITIMLMIMNSKDTQRMRSDWIRGVWWHHQIPRS